MYLQDRKAKIFSIITNIIGFNISVLLMIFFIVLFNTGIDSYAMFYAYSIFGVAITLQLVIASLIFSAKSKSAGLIFFAIFNTLFFLANIILFVIRACD